MTLVVARVTPLGIRVSGDMRITHPNETRAGFLQAALKVILLRPTLCVAYARNVATALSAIRYVDSHDLGVSETEAYLLQEHERSVPKADFLVASLRPSRLVAIKDGQAVVSEAAWLGKHEAFAEYQRIYHDRGHFVPPPEFYDSRESAEDLEVASRMGSAMQGVVFGAGFVTEGEATRVQIPQGGAHATVGEAVIAAHPRVQDNLFAYSTTNHAIAPFFSEPPPGHTGVYDPGFGSAERGSFSYSVMTPAEPGVGVVGVYFHEGRLGALYAPLLLDKPERLQQLRRIGSRSLFDFGARSRLRGLGSASALQADLRVALSQNRRGCGLNP